MQFSRKKAKKGKKEQNILKFGQKFWAKISKYYEKGQVTTICNHQHYRVKEHHEVSTPQAFESHASKKFIKIAVLQILAKFLQKHM